MVTLISIGRSQCGNSFGHIMAGRIYVKKNETATGQHAFENADDFAKFKERFKAA